MKTTTLLAATLLAGSASLAQASTFIAGWDFDNSVGVETVSANWGTQKNSASFYWNGTGPSSDLLTPDFEETFDVESGFPAVDATISNNFLFVDSLTGFDQFSDNFGGTVSSVQFESFGGSLNGDRAIIQFSGVGFADLSIQFAAANTGTGTVNYTWSTDGVNFQVLKTGSSYGTAYELETIDLSSLEGAATAYIGISFAGSANDTYRFDNLQITGVVSAIPEPSSFAALVGLFGLGFAASRRRSARA